VRDRVVHRLRAADGDALVFSHGHLLRVLTARWLGLGPEAGRFFTLGPASISVLGCEENQIPWPSAATTDENGVGAG